MRSRTTDKLIVISHGDDHSRSGGSCSLRSARSTDPVRSKRHSDSPEMSAQSRSNWPRPVSRVHSSWVASAAAMMVSAMCG